MAGRQPALAIALAVGREEAPAKVHRRPPVLAALKDTAQAAAQASAVSAGKDKTRRLQACGCRRTKDACVVRRAGGRARDQINNAQIPF